MPTENQNAGAGQIGLNPQGTLAPSRRRFQKLFLRLIWTLVVASIIAAVVHHGLLRFEKKDGSAAGFDQGLIHGALMPLAVPNLIIGDDVVIYAANNTGRGYKLGYIAGVNVCGLLFFGFFFWRVNRLRQRMNDS